VWPPQNTQTQPSQQPGWLISTGCSMIHEIKDFKKTAVKRVKHTKLILTISGGHFIWLTQKPIVFRWLHECGNTYNLSMLHSITNCTSIHEFYKILRPLSIFLYFFLSNMLTRAHRLTHKLVLTDITLKQELFPMNVGSVQWSGKRWQIQTGQEKRDKWGLDESRSGFFNI